MSLCVVGVPLFLRELYNLTKLRYDTSRLRGGAVVGVVAT